MTVNGMLVSQPFLAQLLPLKGPSSLGQEHIEQMSAADAASGQRSLMLAQCSPEELLKELLQRCQQFDARAWQTEQRGAVPTLVEGANEQHYFLEALPKPRQELPSLQSLHKYVKKPLPCCAAAAAACSGAKSRFIVGGAVS